MEAANLWGRQGDEAVLSEIRSMIEQIPQIHDRHAKFSRSSSLCLSLPSSNIQNSQSSFTIPTHTHTHAHRSHKIRLPLSLSLTLIRQQTSASEKRQKTFTSLNLFMIKASPSISADVYEREKLFYNSSFSRLKST
jgi:hypothetical protein